MIHETKSKGLFVSVAGMSQRRQRFRTGEYETLSLGQWLEGHSMAPSSAIEVMSFLLKLKLYPVSRL